MKSSFIFFHQPIANPDYILPITIEGMQYNVYVLKRPGVDEFFKRIGNEFEVNLFFVFYNIINYFDYTDFRL